MNDWRKKLWGGVLVVSCVLASTGGCGSRDDGEDAHAEAAGLTKACPKSSTLIEGIDVSKWQASVDWPSVRKAGVLFAFARISDGVYSPDAFFNANWQGMKAAAVVRGAYQYFRPGQDPVAQARLLLDALEGAGGLASDDLPPALDLETDDGEPATTVQKRALAWLAEVEKKTGKRPLVYTAAFMSSTVGTSLSAYPLWVANFTGTTAGKCPSMPSGWTAWTLWQYSSTGAVAGVAGNVDRDVFDGTLADLMAFVKASNKGLPNSPPEGWLDEASCEKVRGWAWDADEPRKAVVVEIRIDSSNSQPIVLEANLARADLCSAIGSCAHGFEIPLAAALKDGKKHSVLAHARDSMGGPGADLKASPKTVTCAPAPPQCVDTDADGFAAMSGSCPTGADCDDGDPLTRPGAPEACDGKDNNCNGTVDEGNPGGGMSCSTNKLGVCAAGTINCMGGSLSCVQNKLPGPEVCNGLDDDCDGAIDDGNPGVGASCSTGSPGACAGGATACVAGEIVCVPGKQPSNEICNGVDDDCDGQVDEGCAPAEVCNGLDDDGNGIADDVAACTDCVLVELGVPSWSAPIEWRRDGTCAGPYAWVWTPSPHPASFLRMRAKRGHMYRANACPCLGNAACGSCAATETKGDGLAEWGPPGKPTVAIEGVPRSVLDFDPNRAVVPLDTCALIHDIRSYTPSWVANVACAIGTSAEINCGNGIDDDGDGATDCADPNCAASGLGRPPGSFCP
jgi:GH25 family lysozyme M1 (1,4-beta-N-acetylmuramidase)